MEQTCTAVKRKHTDEPDDDTDHKRLKTESPIDECYIQRLPECLLNVLLSYFDASSLYSLSQTCQLFHDMAKQSKYWRYIDARNPPHDDRKKFAYCCKRMHEGTTHFLYKGKNRTVRVLSDTFFSKTCSWSNLKVLALENQYICGNTYHLKSFPPSMEELSLRKTYVTNGYSFFRFSSSLENLRVLLLDHCQWFETSNLVSIANLKRLEILSLYMCKRLSDSDIGYLSISGDYGLKSIKILDVRFTAVGNQLLTSMYRSPTLQELYFQCYTTTYQLDRSKRLLAMHRGSPPDPHSYKSDDEENLDMNQRRMIQRFGCLPFRMNKTDVVDDGGVSMFKYVQAADTEQSRPKSFLFKDPYTECKCGFYKDFWQNRSIKQSKRDCCSSSDTDDETDIVSKQLKSTIRKRRRQLKKALRTQNARHMYYMVFNTKAKMTDATAPYQWINERAPRTEEEMEMLEHTIVEIPPDEGIIICGQNSHQYSFIGESFLMPSLYASDAINSTDPNDIDTSDEDVSSSSDDDETEHESNKSNDAEANGNQQGDCPNSVGSYLRICFRAQEAKTRCKLNRLSLRGYPKVTDASLQYLKDINLELLDVSHTNVTAKGVRDFLMMHPNCRVVHERACTCGPRMHF